MAPVSRGFWTARNPFLFSLSLTPLDLWGYFFGTREPRPGRVPHLLDKEHEVPQQPSPLTSLCMLLMFKQRRIGLARADYDLYWDTIIAALEECNNETFRLEDEPVTPQA